MKLFEFCSYLEEIGVLTIEEINLFIKIFKSTNQNIQNERMIPSNSTDRRFVDSLFIYLRSILNNETSILNLSLRIIRNSSKAIKEKKLNSIARLGHSLQMKSSLIKSSVLLNIRNHALKVNIPCVNFRYNNEQSKEQKKISRNYYSRVHPTKGSQREYSYSKDSRLDNKNFYDRLYKQADILRQKRNNNRIEQSRKESRSLCFEPRYLSDLSNSSEYTRLSSNMISSFIGNLNRYENKRINNITNKKREIELQENVECTFKPSINRSPLYSRSPIDDMYPTYDSNKDLKFLNYQYGASLTNSTIPVEDQRNVFSKLYNDFIRRKRENRNLNEKQGLKRPNTVNKFSNIRNNYDSNSLQVKSSAPNKEHINKLHNDYKLIKDNREAKCIEEMKHYKFEPTLNQNSLGMVTSTFEERNKRFMEIKLKRQAEEGKVKSRSDTRLKKFNRDRKLNDDIDENNSSPRHHKINTITQVDKVKFDSTNVILKTESNKEKPLPQVSHEKRNAKSKPKQLNISKRPSTKNNQNENENYNKLKKIHNFIMKREFEKEDQENIKPQENKVPNKKYDFIPASEILNELNNDNSIRYNNHENNDFHNKENSSTKFQDEDKGSVSNLDKALRRVREDNLIPFQPVSQNHSIHGLDSMGDNHEEIIMEKNKLEPENTVSYVDKLEPIDYSSMMEDPEKHQVNSLNGSQYSNVLNQFIHKAESSNLQFAQLEGNANNYDGDKEYKSKALQSLINSQKK